MSRLGRTIIGSVLAGAVLALGACGGTDKQSGTPRAPARPRTIDIYSSLPMHGPSAAASAAIVNGIRLALRQAGGRAGQFRVRYISLDDSSASTHGYSAAATAANARRAAADARAVYYMGEFDSAASEISIPILNEAGIAQVSPASTYVGLTTSEPGSAKGEPAKYYPAGTRTFLRIVPRDSVEVAADLLAMRDDGCTKVVEASDAAQDGAEMAQLVALEQKDYGIDVVRDSAIPAKGPDPAVFASALKGEAADCFLLAATASSATVELTKDILAALPRARIFGSDGMCTAAWTNPRDGGVAPALTAQLECTSFTLPLGSYPGGRAFLAAYRARYHVADPNPYAIYGYEAMKLGLSTIAGLGAKGDQKSAVVSALFATRDRRSVLGTYGFDSAGDTTRDAYGLYRVSPAGTPVLERVLTPTKIL